MNYSVGIGVPADYLALDLPWIHIGFILDSPWIHLGFTLDFPWITLSWEWLRWYCHSGAHQVLLMTGSRSMVLRVWQNRKVEDMCSGTHLANRPESTLHVLMVNESMCTTGIVDVG